MRRCAQSLILAVIVGVALVSVVSPVQAVPRPRADAAATEAAKSPDQILADVKAALLGVHTIALHGNQYEGDQRLSLNIVAGEGRGGGVMFVNGAALHVVFAA